MVLVDAWKTVVMQRYAKFDGRAGRAEFWWFVLASAIIGIALSTLGRASVVFLVLYAIYALGVLIPSIAVTVRRLHDTSRSGWWYLLVLIPLVGGIILIVFLATDGTPGPNQYGPPAPPLAPT